MPAKKLAIKGGCNIRFFFGSVRYSEDMDIDIDGAGIPVFELRDKVIRILTSAPLAATLRALGVERLTPPDIAAAKQTETVQRFKVHLLTSAGEDLPTKVEFSRRGLDSPIAAEAVLANITGAYKMPSLIAPHYTAPAAVRQKISALASRSKPAARDVFDLFVLAPRVAGVALSLDDHLSVAQLHEARERAFAMDYHRYRDEVVSFLSPTDQRAHDSQEMWDEIRIVATDLLEGTRD